MENKPSFREVTQPERREAVRLVPPDLRVEMCTVTKGQGRIDRVCTHPLPDDARFVRFGIDADGYGRI